MIQNPTGFSFDFDVVAYILPMKDSSLLLYDGRKVGIVGLLYACHGAYYSFFIA